MSNAKQILHLLVIGLLTWTSASLLACDTINNSMVPDSDLQSVPDSDL